MIPARVSFVVDFEIDANSNSRRMALWRVAARTAELLPNSSKADVASALYARERLGTTAVGGGIAFPHAVVEGFPEPLILVRRLKRPIDFGAPDGRGIDILAAVLGDTTDIKWLRSALIRLERLARDKKLLTQLRSADNSNEVRAILLESGLEVRIARDMMTMGGAMRCKMHALG